MTDPNRPFTNPEAARQMSQQPADAEAQPADALPPTDSLSSASADPAENLVADNPLAPSDVALPESPSLADGANQPEVFGQDVPDAFDGFSPPASIESGDDAFGALDLQPSLSDSTNAATDPTTGAEPSSFPADFPPSEMPSFSGRGPSVDPFAASPPPFTGPLVEVSPGVFVCPDFSMPWSTDSAAAPESAFIGEGGMPLRLEVSWRESDKLLDAIIDRSVARMGRIAEDKIESQLNYEAHLRTALLRAIHGR